MCTGLEIAAVVAVTGALTSGAMGAKGQRAQGKAALNAQFHNAMLSELKGEQIRRNSLQKSARIKEAALRMRGRQQSALAARGIVLGEGSAQAVIDETEALASRDSLISIYDGIAGQQSATEDARIMRDAGTNVASSANAAANATVVSSISSAAGSYASFKSLQTKR